MIDPVRGSRESASKTSSEMTIRRKVITLYRHGG
jgi:hypothetical protein